MSKVNKTPEAQKTISRNEKMNELNNIK